MNSARQRDRTPIIATGIGVVSPIGIGSENFWENLVAGQSGVGQVRTFDTSGMKSHCGAEVRDFSFADCSKGRAWPSNLGRTTQLALAAADMAVEEAGLTSGPYDPSRVAVVCGSTVSEPRVPEEFFPRCRRYGLGSLSPEQFPQLSPGMIAATVAQVFGFRGPCLMVLTSCASGNQAIGYACDLIRSGRVDAALVGGADALSMVTYVGFNRLLSLATERCQPFDLNREGVVLGEGAAFLALERGGADRQRRVHVHGEIIGHGLGFDAHHISAPHPDGIGGEQAIRAAIAAAGIGVDDIDYISAHGTGTPSNDKSETKLIKRVFGERAFRIPISSIKSMIGHTMGAASAIEAAACLLALERGVIPPTINYETPDPDCDLDYVPNTARVQPIHVALSQAFAFGGNTSALLIRRHTTGPSADAGSM